MKELRINELMKKLNCSREEAIQIIADDEAIDKGEKLFELSAEEKQIVKKMTNVTEHKKNGTVKRERKPDEEKQEIISEIAGFLSEKDNFLVKIIKNEREIELIVGENNYSITLTKHRPPKK